MFEHVFAKIFFFYQILLWFFTFENSLEFLEIEDSLKIFWRLFIDHGETSSNSTVQLCQYLIFFAITLCFIFILQMFFKTSFSDFFLGRESNLIFNFNHNYLRFYIHLKIKPLKINLNLNLNPPKLKDVLLGLSIHGLGSKLVPARV